MSYSSTHTEFWSGISLSATREASLSKVLLETPEGMKESAEKEWTPRALVNEGNVIRQTERCPILVPYIWGISDFLGGNRDSIGEC